MSKEELLRQAAEEAVDESDEETVEEATTIVGSGKAYRQRQKRKRRPKNPRKRAVAKKAARKSKAKRKKASKKFWAGAKGKALAKKIGAYKKQHASFEPLDVVRFIRDSLVEMIHDGSMDEACAEDPEMDEVVCEYIEALDKVLEHAFYMETEGDPEAEKWPSLPPGLFQNVRCRALFRSL